MVGTEGLDGDFYEDDEPVEKIKAAYDLAPHFLTARPSPDRGAAWLPPAATGNMSGGSLARLRITLATPEREAPERASAGR